MKKNFSNKTHLVPILFLVIIFSNSCKRDIDTPAITETNISVQQAKDFFIQKTNLLLETGNIISTSLNNSKSKKNAIKNLGNYVRWASNKQISTNQASFLLIDIDDSKIFFKKNISVIRKLVFSKTNSSNLEMNVVEVISFKKMDEAELLEKIKTSFIDYQNGIPQKSNKETIVLIYDANYVRSSTFVKEGNTPSIKRTTVNLRENTLQTNVSNSNRQSTNSVDCVLWGVFFIEKDGYGNVISETLLYTYYVGECGGVVTTEDNGEGAPVGGEMEANLDAMYQQMMNDFAESTEDDNSYAADISLAGIDPIMGIHTWTVGRHTFGSWAIVADTKYGYYHTEYFDVPQMRMVQNYNAFLYKTEKITFSGWNSLVTSTWTTSSLVDLILNNNTENAKGRTVVTGNIDHTMHMKIKIGSVEVDKVYSSTSHVTSNPFELTFR